MSAPVELIGACLAHAGPLRNSPWHGEQHWMRVAMMGARLLGEEPGADAQLVLMFALLHDARRENEYADPGHGPRAALLARAINDDALGLSYERLEVLAGAIHDHNGAGPSDEPTRAVCFDADRLTLWRVGIRPDPALLSTATARRPGMIIAGRDLEDESVSWEMVGAAYQPLFG